MTGTSFPPRLEQHPGLYPITNEGQAVQMARDGNTKDEASAFVGCVTPFCVNSDNLAKFERRIVDSSEHQELHLPPEVLAQFTEHVVATLNVVREFRVEPTRCAH